MLDTATVLELLDEWQENVDEILLRADQADVGEHFARARELRQRAYAFSQARVDLKRRCPALNLPKDPSEVFTTPGRTTLSPVRPGSPLEDV